MTTSITQACNGLSIKKDGRRMQQLLTAVLADLTTLQTASGSSLYNSGGLAIHGSASALAKTVNTVYFAIAGLLYSKTAADMAALSGSVTNTKFNVYCFYVSSAGTLTSAMGTEASTLAGVAFPVTPVTKALIGFVIVNPTGTGPFVGGTTALDDATVVPNAVYVNTVGSSSVPATLTTVA